jgi:hypothetical protein
MSDADTTPRLKLPMLAAGQAQKEITHNEALAILDLSVGTAVAGIGATVPPAAPGTGSAWIVGGAPTGAWAGQAGRVAGWTDGGWRFVVPHEGMAVWSLADRREARFVGGIWVLGEVRASRLLVDGVAVVGAQVPAIPTPSGGAAIDTVARAAIAAMLQAMRGHGLIAR